MSYIWATQIHHFFLSLTKRNLCWKSKSVFVNIFLGYVHELQQFFTGIVGGMVGVVVGHLLIEIYLQQLCNNDMSAFGLFCKMTVTEDILLSSEAWHSFGHHRLKRKPYKLLVWLPQNIYWNIFNNLEALFFKLFLDLY